jgi:hypothetical protein
MGDTFMGPNTSNNNTFMGDNMSTLQLADGISYEFGPNTRNNVVVGHTGGTGNVIEGAENFPAEPNSFTGPGFTGLDANAAQQLRDAMKLSNEATQMLNAAKTEHAQMIADLKSSKLM